MRGKVIEFLRSKDYKFIDEIGQGGTGRTVLLEDELINERFVCKKYSTYYEEHQPLFFNNFKEEIKLLHLIYHKNIVRVFNYYLYPEQYTGYILMEHIKGSNIYTFLKQNPDRLNDTFTQTIEGFKNLEANKILHRDIRPDNILVANDGTVKIIDFGFGKKIGFDENFNKSISLNWRYSPPADFDNKIYDFKTEVYFIGKLFEEIITENELQNFSYTALLKRMTLHDYDKRISSFFEVQRQITSDESIGIEFTEEEKSIYLRFASCLSDIYSKINVDSEYATDIDKIIAELEDVYRNSMLETYIQNHNSIATCFVRGDYSYYTKREIEVEILKDFLNFIKSVSKDKRKVIINNIWQRLDTVEREVTEDDLPF
jgi:serine/threonine protein kinase